MRGFIDNVATIGTRSGTIFESIVDGRRSDLVVTLGKGAKYLLPAQDVRLPLLEQFFESAHHDGARLYFEGNGDRLNFVRPTISGHILSLEESSTGEIEVEISNSHAIHLLRSDNPEFDELAKLLKEAHGAGSLITIVERRGIIAVQPDDGKMLLTEAEVVPPGRLSLLEAAVLPPVIDWKVVAQVFQTIVLQDCPVANVQPPCIPFTYPTNWCWTRAHAMARTMRMRHDITPGKLWIRGRLRAQTLNDPDCHVRWGWHVAPVLMTRPEGGGAEFPVVIDPSMFDQPVPQERWVTAQGDPNAILNSTSWEVYNYTTGGAELRDETFSLVDDGLRSARRNLLAQIADDGPPPYANCTI